MATAIPSFDAIHRQYRAKLVRYLAGFVGAEEAADLAQVTMMKVSGHLASFRGESSLSTWLYRIATNVALDRLRQRSPELVALDGGADDEEPDAQGLPSQLQAPSAEAAAERSEMSACVREFVDRLPVDYRTVLVLSDLEGFTNPQIAEITGWSLDNVKMRLHRARLRLRAGLRDGCTIGRDGSNEVACDRKPPRAAREPYPFTPRLRPKG